MFASFLFPSSWRPEKEEFIYHAVAAIIVSQIFFFFGFRFAGPLNALSSHSSKPNGLGTLIIPPPTWPSLWVWQILQAIDAFQSHISLICPSNLKINHLRLLFFFLLSLALILAYYLQTPSQCYKEPTMKIDNCRKYGRDVRWEPTFLVFDLLGSGEWSIPARRYSIWLPSFTDFTSPHQL